MNFAARVLASTEAVEALTYDQFRKWNYDKQVDYLNRHPESDFRLPEDEDGGTPQEEDKAAGTPADGGEGGGAPAPEQEDEGGESEEEKAPAPAPKEDGTGGPGSIGTPKTGDGGQTPIGTGQSTEVLPEIAERGTMLTNKKTGQKAVRMDYDNSRDLIEEFLNKGWALKYDLATGSQLEKGDTVITLTTEPSGNSRVEVGKAGAVT